MQIGLLYFVSLFGYGLFFKTLLPKMKLGGCLLSGFCTMVLTAYTSIGLLGFYNFGPKLVFGFGYLFFFIGCVVYLVRNNGQVDYKIFLNPAFLTFVLCMGVTAFLLNGAVLKNHDAYSYWGRAVREMYMFRSSYFNAFASMPHIDYNFAVPTLQYSLMCEFGWSDAYLLYVLTSGVVSSICLMMDKFGKRLFSALVFLLLCILFYPLLATGYSIHSLTIDGLMGLTFLGGLFTYFNREDNSLPALVPTITCAAMLPTLKMYTGVLFAAILCIIVLAEMLWKRYRKSPSGTVRLGVVIAMIILVLFSEFSWRIYYNYNYYQMTVQINDETNEYFNEINLNKNMPVPLIAQSEKPSLWEYIAGNKRTKMSQEIPAAERNAKIKSGLKVAAKNILAPLSEKSKVNYITLTMTLLLVLVAVLIVSNKQKRRMLLSVFLAIVIAGVIYIIGFVVTFYVQPGVEGETLRYLGVVTIPFAFLTFYGVCSGFTLDKKGILCGGLAIVTAVVMFMAGSQELYHRAYVEKVQFKATSYTQQMLDAMDEYLLEDDINLIVDNSKYNWRYGESGIKYTYSYNALPKRVVAMSFKSTLRDTRVIKDEFNSTVLERNKRVFISVVNGQVKEDLSKIIGVKLWPNYIYVFDVHYNDGTVKYEYVNRVTFNVQVP